ncbi:MAG: GNAT family N-acetyltransferase [Terracoccus sp.]
MSDPTGLAWLTTPRLVLRRPTPDDRDDYARIHGDPRTYSHAPESMPSPEHCLVRLAENVGGWETEGIGYAAVLDRVSGAVIGWAGLRPQEAEGRRLFNLYYRLEHERLGEGLGREIARACVAWAAENRPDLPVTAFVDDGNAASFATARAAGLTVVGQRTEPGAPRSMALLEAPHVEVPDRDGLDGAVADEIVDLWVAVNDAGGSVGFLPGASRVMVRAALDRHLAQVADSRSVPCLLREADGTLRGLGFWQHDLGFPLAHVADLQRLMVDPAGQGRNLGRILLAGMVGIVRRELPAAELLRLSYRDGLGLGGFYSREGWAEVGRVPRGLWLGGDDYRDDVAMARRVDGAPLR